MSKKWSQFNEASGFDGSEEFVGLQNGVNVRSKLPFRGMFDASVNQYPSGGGSGPSGAIFAGNHWVNSTEGQIDVYGIGVITVYPGALFISIVDNPGQTNSNWKVLQ